MIKETAYYEGAGSTETLDLYEPLLENGVSVDFWFPKGQRPTSMDLHVVFERDDATPAPSGEREMEQITYLSEQDRDYAKSLKAAQTYDALKAHVSAWRSVADDAFQQVAAQSFDFDEFQEGRKKENRNEYAGDGWVMKYGAILMPKIMIRVCVVAQQYGAPWGCAYIRLKEAGVIDDSSGIAVWKERDDSSNDIS